MVKDTFMPDLRNEILYNEFDFVGRSFVVQVLEFRVESILDRIVYLFRRDVRANLAYIVLLSQDAVCGSCIRAYPHGNCSKGRSVIAVCTLYIFYIFYVLDTILPSYEISRKLMHSK